MRLPFGEPMEQDPAAEFEALRGGLERFRVPPGGRVHRPGRRGKVFQEVELVTIPEASLFTSDRPLCDPEAFLEELGRQPGRHEAGRPELDSLDELWERIAPAYNGGRPRGEGNWYAAYLHMVLSGGRNPNDYWLRHARKGAPIAGFRSLPPLSLLELRFAELEDAWEIVAEHVAQLVRIACEAVPEIAEVWMVDSTAWRSAAYLHHCCTDLEACGRAGVPQNMNLSPQEFQAKLKEARKREAELAEEEVERNPLTRQAAVWFDDENKRGPHAWRLFFINGHWYCSLDLTSGFRRYDNGAMWHGGYDQFPITPVVWLPLAGHCFPCDIAETDGYPTLFELGVRATGAVPHFVSVDRGFGFTGFHEGHLRRDSAVVGPRRWQKGQKEHIEFRTDLFDEDGMPRCVHCGGVGLIDAPGLGLQRRGRDPRLAFRCAAPFLPACEHRQLIDPLLDPVSLLPLSRLTELYQSIRYWHQPSEGVHRRIRWNYMAGGNDIASTLWRPGVPAQRLRMWAALDLAWWRLLLRQGWIPAQGLDVSINPTRLVRLSGIQDRSTLVIKEPGAGSARLARLNAERDANLTNFPYGEAWERLRARVLAELDHKETD